ncbi:MAG: hypothetical protein H6584_08460 [Flavobacteriales bacterium]|nr:hypothetical protein [Flavobacteriales bacterium]
MTSSIFLNSCTPDADVYHFTVSNRYFEPLYNTTVNSVFFDTILVNVTTPISSIPPGSYKFTTETESGLRLSTDIVFKGKKQNVALIVNERGKLITE